MGQANNTRNFYNNYASKEWDRLDKTGYDKLNYLLHMDFVSEYLKEGIDIFDVGCGAGRFSVEFTKSNCNVHILDISDEQLKIARSKIKEYGVIDNLKSSLRGNIENMNMLEDNKFDLTVCYGAPLNYLYDNYKEGIKELYRVTKPGGNIVASVNSRLGVIRMVLGKEKFDINGFMGRPDYWFINSVLEKGDLPEHPEVSHPPRHMFNAQELKKLFKEVGFKDIELASSPSVISGLRTKADELYENEIAWKTMIDIELKSYKNEYLADSGEFLMIRATK